MHYYLSFFLLLYPLIIGLVLASLVFVWIRTMAMSAWILVGAYIGSWVTFYAMHQDPNRVDEVLLPIWERMTGMYLRGGGNFGVIIIILINRLLLD